MLFFGTLGVDRSASRRGKKRVRELYVVRHGETVWNVEQRVQGRLDSALTVDGQAQAGVNGECIRSLGEVQLVIASPLGRTRETAYLINSFVGAPIQFEDALMERDCGDWSGFTLAELEAQFPQAFAERNRDPFHHRPPNGENLPDMLARVQPFLDSLFQLEHDAIALVTHGIMSRAILTYFLDLGPVEASRVRHPNDLVYRLRFGATDVEVDHFLAGAGPTEGLLRRVEDGTIVRPKKNKS